MPGLAFLVASNCLKAMPQSFCCHCCACPTMVSVLQLPVRALCFSPDASHAISAAVGERLVAVWVAPQQGGKKKSGGVAAASLAVAQPVVQLATTGGSRGKVEGLDGRQTELPGCVSCMLISHSACAGSC